MSKSIYPIQIHNHHILPKHLGGDDSPNNLIPVSIPMHAVLHKDLYKHFGRSEDLWAWRFLSGMSLEKIPKSEETKRKISLGSIGKKMPPRSEEWKRKQSLAHKGKKLPAFSEERKKNMSLAHIGKHPTEETRLKLKKRIPWNKGKFKALKPAGPRRGGKGILKSTEHKRKISQGLLGHKVSKETREKQRIMKLGNNNGAGNKGRIPWNKGKSKFLSVY